VGFYQEPGGGGGLTLISQLTKTDASSNVFTFDSIPQTFKNLKLIVNAKSNSTANPCVVATLKCNNDSTSAIYEWQVVYADSAGTVVTGIVTTTGTAMEIGAFSTSKSGVAAGTAGSIETDIINYAGTAFYKNISSYSSGRTQYAWDVDGEYKSTSAITRLDIADSVGNFDTGSTVMLYGY
jgi:hypothetical protein